MEDISSVERIPQLSLPGILNEKSNISFFKLFPFFSINLKEFVFGEENCSKRARAEPLLS